MARRNDHTKEEIRNMIVKTGCKLIEESGFSEFSTRKIAKKIGYTVGTLYNVYENYDDIILHINANTLDEMHNFIESRLNDEAKGGDSIKNLAKTYIEFANRNPNRWGALFEYNISQDLCSSEWYNKKIEKLFSIVESFLLEFISDKSEISKHTKVIWSSVHGICVLSLTKKLNSEGVESVESLTDSLIDNYLRGLENDS